jgi:DNA polymerase-3 subunit gamma/tau
MTYQVLARKWRPRRFEEMVGQPHVLRALTNTLDHDRLHHAYLFTGTRGVGKTTIARIFAKALNCEQGVSAHPCGQCASCMEIDEGRHVDLIEVDAASRTKVDETRELLDNVQYSPTRGRFKVYLIDEVHMFSNHSFNALLKTLEEPPPHVKFLLATTDPKKIPVTILSRCLQFNLKRLGLDLIEAQLERILAEERVPADARSRRLIALAADGSLRDALSLLDQAIAYGGGALKEDEVGAMLGTLDQGQVLKILDHLVAKDTKGLFEHLAAMAELSPDFSAVLGEMLALLQRVALCQIAPEVIKDNSGDEAAIQALAHRLTPEDCQLYYQIALVGRRDLPWVPDPRRGFEMILLRMLAFSEEESRPQPSASPRPAPSPPPRAPMAVSRNAGEINARMWPVLVNELSLSGLVRELAMNCVFKGQSGDDFRLVLSPTLQHLRNERAVSRLEQSLRTRYGEALRLVLTLEDPAGLSTPVQIQTEAEQKRQAAAREAIEHDPQIKTICELFDAEIDGASIRPH